MSDGKKLSDAFAELAATINVSKAEVELAPFSHACSLVTPFFNCLGFAFKFAEMDYVAKVEDLAEASKTISMLPAMLDRDMEADTVEKLGSHTRNLLRVKRGLEMIKVLCEEILKTEGNSLIEPASKAYAQAFAPYHAWAIRKAVDVGMYALPAREHFVRKVNEDESLARVQMQTYVTASAVVIMYVDNLFLSRNLGIDW